MNYLAHVFLAQHSDLAMIGAILGDFSKDCDLERLPPEALSEIRVHREIDKFTDAHPATRSASSLFQPEVRRFSGILLDLFYDHFLARRWDQYCDVPLPAFSGRFYSALRSHEAALPASLLKVAPHMIREDWLLSYRDTQGIELAVARLSTRLSKHEDRFRAGIHAFFEHYDKLDDTFVGFFPDLQRHVRQIRAAG